MEKCGKEKRDEVGGRGAGENFVVDRHEVKGQVVELKLVEDIGEDEIEQKEVDNRDKVAVFA